MKSGISALSRAVVSIAGALALVAWLPQAAVAQSDPFIGTWKLNAAKSTYKPGPTPRSVTLVGEPDGQGLRLVGDAIDAAGMPAHFVFTIVYDGMIHPITGFAPADGNAVVRTDPYTVEYVNTKAGALVQTGTITFAMDGRSLTIATRGINPAGQKVDNFGFYDKQ